jgi:AraC family transcriptional regulator
MKPTIIAIKNMVCHRCVISVENILTKLNIPYDQVLVGEAFVNEKPNEQQQQKLDVELKKIGLEMIDNRQGTLIEKIKKLIILKARNEAQQKSMKLKLSNFLSDHLHHEYTYLSNLFSTIEGKTIESFFIEQRIEKAKELLVYDQMTLSEIADSLEYSSVAHLSTQFKRITGLTPTHFKKIGDNKRKTLDKI